MLLVVQMPREDILERGADDNSEKGEYGGVHFDLVPNRRDHACVVSWPF
jgi:hypothetical protein